MVPFLFLPPVIQAASQVVPLKEAVEQVMQDFDAEDPALPLRDPMVARAERPSLRWLRSAALSEIPNNPFHKGTPSFAEAEALLTLLKADRTQAEMLLPQCKIQEPGTALALWRWAKRQERATRWSPATRRVWEDKLMAKSVPSVLNDYALRHGLCWALAEKDETRFAALKAAWGQDAPTLFASFQGLFGWFGDISPELRLWTLPGLAYLDRRLDLLLAFDGSKSNRIWISPEIDSVASLPKLPAHTAWIIPSATGGQSPTDTSLNTVENSAATTLSQRVAAAKGQAYLAPSRGEFEAFGLVFFPILIELDPKGAIKDIRMGDAAPPRP
jgi:hypothetical protein